MGAVKRSNAITFFFFFNLNTLYHKFTSAIVYNKNSNLTHASGGKLSCKLNFGHAQT